MSLAYTPEPHHRKHGPSGYADYTSYKPWLRDEFTFRCVYCLERERWYPSGQDAFGVDHVKPKGNAAYQGLVCAYTNLVYACNRCNATKGENLLLDPCAVGFGRHLRIWEDGRVEGLTAEGQDLVDLLCSNDPQVQETRRQYLRVGSMYRKYPDDAEVRALYLAAFGFPLDLPNLDDLKPEGNQGPEGRKDSYWRQRAQGRLPEVYA